MSRENAVSVLEHLAMVLQVPQLVFNEEDVVEFSIEESLGVIMYYADELDALISNIIICPIEEGDMESLYRILCGNYMWGYSGGGNLSIDQESGLLCLQHMYEFHADDVNEHAYNFEEAFMHVVSAAIYWRDSMEQGAESSVVDEAPPHESHFPHALRI